MLFYASCVHIVYAKLGEGSRVGLDPLPSDQKSSTLSLGYCTRLSNDKQFLSS